MERLIKRDLILTGKFGIDNLKQFTNEYLLKCMLKLQMIENLEEEYERKQNDK